MGDADIFSTKGGVKTVILINHTISLLLFYQKILFKKLSKKNN